MDVVRDPDKEFKDAEKEVTDVPICGMDPDRLFISMSTSIRDGNDNKHVGSDPSRLFNEISMDVKCGYTVQIVFWMEPVSSLDEISTVRRDLDEMAVVGTGRDPDKLFPDRIKLFNVEVI